MIEIAPAALATVSGGIDWGTAAAWGNKTAEQWEPTGKNLGIIGGTAIGTAVGWGATSPISGVPGAVGGAIVGGVVGDYAGSNAARIAGFTYGAGRSVWAQMHQPK